MFLTRAIMIPKPSLHSLHFCKTKVESLPSKNFSSVLQLEQTVYLCSKNFLSPNVIGYISNCPEAFCGLNAMISYSTICACACSISSFPVTSSVPSSYSYVSLSHALELSYFGRSLLSSSISLIALSPA